MKSSRNRSQQIHFSEYFCNDVFRNSGPKSAAADSDDSSKKEKSSKGSKAFKRSKTSKASKSLKASNNLSKRKQSAGFGGSSYGKEFGGSLHGRGNAKTARPLSTKHAMHVVLRSSLAKGNWSLRSVENIKMVEQTLRKLANKYGIKIYKFANVGNHLHLLIKLGNRFTFAPFMRAFAGISAMKVTGARKLAAIERLVSPNDEDSTDKFWDFRPWSRIVEWGKAYAAARSYVIQNEMEASGEVPYKPRRKKCVKSA
jgi:REP element-mobilizing transposase RayT